jgi:hypothetical protein
VGGMPFPPEMEKYPNEWIALTRTEPPGFLGHGPTPKEAIRDSGKSIGEIVLYWNDGSSRIRI